MSKKNTFVNAVKEETKVTFTENGMEARNTTDSACLDLFAVIGALRTGNSNPKRNERLFSESFNEDALLAMKTLFYSRDVRQGLGERDTFRELLKYAAIHHPEAVRPNIGLIGFYGRYDDLYCLIGTPVEEDMWKAMKAQFEEDKKNLDADKEISLLAKWIKTPDASSKETRRLGILTAKKLGYKVYDFKRILRAMRKKIGIVESQMSANDWESIEYPNLPSRAAFVYRNAFKRHDEERYNNYIQAAVRGEEKINAGTLYPYDIVEKVLYNGEKNDTLEAQWKNLPDYVESGKNVLVMADVSGSMSGRPMASAIGLGIYFAERNTGDFHNLFMTFSECPEFVNLKGETLYQKIYNMSRAKWDMNTNIEAAFMKILSTAVKNNVPAEDMPEAIIAVTDMEFDVMERYATKKKKWTFYKDMKKRYKDAGYKIPHVVFWNVRAAHDTFHADKDRAGVTLVSGHALSSFKAVLKCINMTPYEMMLEVLNSKRYEAITIE